MAAKELIIFIDCGDTLVDESTEIRDEEGVVTTAELYPGVEQAIRTLHDEGYRIALVADGLEASFQNIIAMHHLEDCFEAMAISETVGAQKPSCAMFGSAMDQMGLTDKDAYRIVMIGNNLERDIVGANRMGFWSVLAAYSPRYRMTPECEEERPDYVAKVPSDIPGIVERICLPLPYIAQKNLIKKEYPSRGNAFRINNQSLKRYPMTLIIHDKEHWDLTAAAERIFSGRYPLGYIGSSPWVGTVTNQETLEFSDAQNREFYDLLCAQMEIGWVVYGLSDERKSEIPVMATYMKERFPDVKQVRIYHRKELPADAAGRRETDGIVGVGYETPEELDAWLEELTKEIEKSNPPFWFDSLCREGAEWTNLSLTLPLEEEKNRILLVGDSISAGYGDMVQRLMPGWHVDRLNTSEGLHHPNFLRMLEAALRRYPYRMIHINNGIHLHGQDLGQYRQNLLGVFAWIHMAAPKTEIIYATNTTFSRKAEEGTMEEALDFQERHFGKGGKASLARYGREDYWVTDEKASKPYEELNQIAREICKEHGIRINDLYQVCLDENLQKTDGAHFTEEAYWRLAAQVAEVLKKELC